MLNTRKLLFHTFFHYIELFTLHHWLRASYNAHNNKYSMEGIPLALVAENTPMIELLVGENLECISECKPDSVDFQIDYKIMIFQTITKKL